MVSAMGKCRPFDVRCDGTVFGSGVGIVVLKPLQAAVEAGDRIHAVIRGSAINNDGSKKMGYAAPNPAAQADCIAEAHAVADIDSSTVSYIEAHGTATPLGDPIEIKALRTAFEVSSTPRPGPCALGAVKSNIGHLEVASGVAGLIKTILCLKNKAIPATLHYTSPNPELHLDETPFVVQTEYGPWDSDGVRRAGVSSFGVGGTNAHVVVEEAPPVPARAEQPGPQVLLLSAKTAAALGDARSELAAALDSPDAPELGDVAASLARRRKHNVRAAVAVHDRQHAITVLRASEHDNVFAGESPTAPTTPTTRTGWCSCFPARGRSTRGWRAGSTTPSRSSPSTSTPARRASATSWVSTCTPWCSATALARRTTWNVPIGPNLPCSQWNTRWASWSKATACAPGRWPDTASANTPPPHWPGCSTCPPRSRWCPSGPASCMPRRRAPWSPWRSAPTTSPSTCPTAWTCPR